jgi:hypothetical protein
MPSRSGPPSVREPSLPASPLFPHVQIWHNPDVTDLLEAHMDPQTLQWLQTGVGLALCLCGWTLLSFGLAVLGLVVGAISGFVLVDQMMARQIELQQWWWLWVVVPLTLAALGAWLLRRVYRFLFFLAAALVAGMAKTWLDSQFNMSRLLAGSWGAWVDSPWFDLAWVLVWGLVLCLMHRMVVIALTSVAGAVLISRAWQHPELLPVLVCAAIVAQLGLIRLSPVRRKRTAESEETA